MDAVTPVTITTPDGVERSLRSTLGSRKRISEHFGITMPEAIKKYGEGAIPAILWAMLHDEQGQPPPFSVQYLEDNLPSEQATALFAAILSASTNGRTSKNELEGLMLEVIRREIGLPTGATSSDSALSSSDSQKPNSGGDTSNAKLSPESSTTTNISDSSIIEAA